MTISGSSASLYLGASLKWGGGLAHSWGTAVKSSWTAAAKQQPLRSSQITSGYKQRWTVLQWQGSLSTEGQHEVWTRGPPPCLSSVLDEKRSLAGVVLAGTLSSYSQHAHFREEVENQETNVRSVREESEMWQTGRKFSSQAMYFFIAWKPVLLYVSLFTKWCRKAYLIFQRLSMETDGAKNNYKTQWKHGQNLFKGRRGFYRGRSLWSHH